METGNLMFDLMNLQGHLRLKFMSMGIDELKAHNLSTEALHLFATNKVIKPEYFEAYAELCKGVKEIQDLFIEEAG